MTLGRVRTRAGLAVTSLLLAMALSPAPAEAAAQCGAVDRIPARADEGDSNLVYSGGPYGENIAWGSADLSGTDAVKMWVDEKPNYDYGSNSCVGG